MTVTNPHMLRYELHGCSLQSSFVISDLDQCGDGSADSFAVFVTRTGTLWNGDESTFAPWRPDDVLPYEPEVRMQYWKGSEGYLIRFKGYADFLVGLDGTSIIAYLPDEDLSQFIRDLLVGPILAVALQIQGAFAIHGSCVTRDGTAIAFIGDNGAGKSTLAARYVADGWELLTDGMFVAMLKDDQAWAQPGDPRIRVRPDAAGGLTCLSQVDTQGQQGASKYRLAIGGHGWGQFSRVARPLRVAYVLEPAGSDTDITIQPCTGADAIMTALVNTYGIHTYQDELLAPHLRYAERFLRIVPLRKLRYAKKLENLGPMIEAVTTDAWQFLDVARHRGAVQFDHQPASFGSAQRADKSPGH